jgi:acyl dehydratase
MSTAARELPIEWSEEFNVGDDDYIRCFSALINDFNPIHHNAEAAKRLGLDGIVAPGVMIMGFVSSAIARQIPGVIALKIEIKLLNPLYAKSRVLVKCETISVRRTIARINIHVNVGLEPVIDGECILLLPLSYY